MIFSPITVFPAPQWISSKPQPFVLATFKYFSTIGY